MFYYSHEDSSNYFVFYVYFDPHFLKLTFLKKETNIMDLFENIYKPRYLGLIW